MAQGGVTSQEEDEKSVRGSTTTAAVSGGVAEVNSRQPLGGDGEPGRQHEVGV